MKRCCVVPVTPSAAYTCTMEHEERLPAPAERLHMERRHLHHQWRRLGWVATLVAVLTSPALYMWFREQEGWSVGGSLVATFFAVIAFRGMIDLASRWMIPSPSLTIDDTDVAKQKDAVSRRRVSFWRSWFKFAIFLASLTFVIWVVRLLTAAPGESPGYVGSFTLIFSSIKSFGAFGLILPFYFIFNFLILLGPLMIMGISQIKAYEPGDTDWGVKLADVRGQAEAKEEVRRVVTLWQSGELFEKAGGKRERGLLMLGAPGTGKTMLSKGIATGFNCPFISIPGSGFAQTFIGMDAVIVRYLAWRAKRLARKWGGQCIVFIDEIDAVGMRRASLGQGGRFEPSIHDLCFFGPQGALNPSGELLYESREWRERIFAERAVPTPSPYPQFVNRLNGVVNQMMPGGMFGGGGQLALNQLLVVMDGIGDPPFFRRFFTNRINTFLDACYVVPQRIKAVPLRLPRPRPRREQIYFIGACNVPIESLDPALTRPGRLGRHVWFRTPNKNDRKDIFDLYMGKVSHSAELNTDERLDELARMTPGYSPAMIEQVCSMALTRAHYAGRMSFDRDDIIESMTTIESGMAIDVEVLPEESRAVAVHEAGHAIASHVYMEGSQSTRLSIRHRGSSLGHHAARETEERFSSWHHEQTAQLIWGLGAMAAERVFYAQNSIGVGGDVQTATAQASMMVGRWAMGPPRIDLDGRFKKPEQEAEERQKIMARFEEIGTQIMNRASVGGPFDHDPVASVMGDRDKRRMVSQILGHAFVTAYALVRANRDAVDHIAEVLVQRREFYGDDVIALLQDADLQRPEIDYLDEDTWPVV
ncbi:MAG: cell division protease FtsH [Gaiellales bacterium]|nr:cell division protease FtsH [Gaiellales bacterium]